MSKVTMDYIARIAKVSKSTVSRALSNDPRVNEDTRKRINQIARSLNYKPHQVAQALAKNNTNIIGVVIPWLPRSVGDPFFLEFLQGIGEVAHERGYSLTFPNVEMDRIDSLLDANLDGIILTEPCINDPRIELLKGRGIPFVFLGNPMSGDDVCWVEVDNETGAYQAVNYLIKSGHKKIATIAGSSDLIAGKYRLEGYKRALLENGFQLDDNLIRYADFTLDGAYKATRELLKGGLEFSAVFAANDLMAMGVIRALKEADIKVPKEIAVMGYDGIQIGEFIEPPLSTIKLPSVKMGRVAMNLLLKLINNEKIEERQVLLSPRLLLRQSA